MHSLGQLFLHKVVGLGFILVSPVHLGLQHDLAWARLLTPNSRKCVLCSWLSTIIRLDSRSGLCYSFCYALWERGCCLTWVKLDPPKTHEENFHPPATELLHGVDGALCRNAATSCLQDTWSCAPLKFSQLPDSKWGWIHKCDWEKTAWTKQGCLQIRSQCPHVPYIKFRKQFRRCLSLTSQLPSHWLNSWSFTKLYSWNSAVLSPGLCSQQAPLTL